MNYVFENYFFFKTCILMLVVNFMYIFHVPSDNPRMEGISDFGLFQHAILQLLHGQETIVHVIYHHSSRDFAHSGPIKRLKSQSHWKTVLSKSQADRLSRKGHSVICVIILNKCFDCMTERVLEQTVESARCPGSQSLYLLTGGRLPGWMHWKLSQSTVMVYPCLPEEKTQFWERFIALIGLYFEY